MPEFFQRYLAKSRPEEIAYDDLRKFLAQRLEEHQTLEYKSGEVLVRDGKLWNPDDRHDVRGIVSVAKAVAGLANAEGGLLVLGVRQKPEKHQGSIVRILPGRVTPVPGYITREVIENNLRRLIQFPIENLAIRALRQSTRRKDFVYLIDVPQSLRPPHRVRELYYYQRYNFSTLEMQHYQITDLYGRRLGPLLDVETTMPAPYGGPTPGRFFVQVRLRNHGNVVAKYVMTLCSIVSGEYRLLEGHTPWELRNEGKGCQHKLGIDSVVYPDTHTELGALVFEPTTPKRTSISLQFYVYAEAMPAQTPVIGFTQDVLPEIPPPKTEEQLFLEREIAELQRENDEQADW